MAGTLISPSIFSLILQSNEAVKHENHLKIYILVFSPNFPKDFD